MAFPGDELSSIDFESLIGGPLVAVVNAQAQSAITTVNFIKSVGFKQPADEFEAGEHSETSDPIYVSFRYPKEISPYQPRIPAVPADPGPAVPEIPEAAAVYEDHELRVPILTMLPIPYLRIEEVTVDFNAKINSIEYTRTDSKVKSVTQASGGVTGGIVPPIYGAFFGSAKLKTSFTYQQNTRSGNRVERTYSMAVHVRAVQDEMPGGMERILGILEDAIVSKPTSQLAGTTHPVDKP